MRVGYGSALALALGACVMVDEPEAAAPVTDADALQAVYVVGDGDTLAGIARRFAVPGGWRALAAANHLLDPDHVEANQGLIVPTGGIVAAGRDPFSLFDELELIPRRAPVTLPVTEVAPIAPEDLDWSRDADAPDTCGGRHHHLELEPSAVDDPDQPHCAALSRATLCVVAATSPDDGEAEDADAALVTVDGRPWLTLPYSFHAPLEIVEVDLDDDGDDELVLSDLVGVSMGAAIATYAMVVATGPGAPPHRYATSAWQLTATAGGCTLAHDTFEQIDDPVEGSGNYDVVRDLVWQDGALATRGAGIRAQRWSAQPPQLRGEPLLAGQLLTRRTATVVDFDDAPGGQRALTLTAGADRFVLTQRTWRWSDDDPEPDPEQEYAGLGWAGAAVLLPENYRPPAATLIGRDATIETRLDVRSGELTQVVWLGPR